MAEHFLTVEGEEHPLTSPHRITAREVWTACVSGIYHTCRLGQFRENSDAAHRVRFFFESHFYATDGEMT